jgi:hypothetical protein
MIVAAAALLAKNPEPSDAQIREALDVHLCRCGTQDRIVRAVKRAAGKLDASAALAIGAMGALVASLAACEPPAPPNRRQILAGAGFLILGFCLGGREAFAQEGGAAAPARLPGSLASNKRLDAWLRISPDGTVTVLSGKVELGQGIRTALAQIVADELDVDITRLRMVAADTDLSPDESYTSGSMSIQQSGSALRQAGAEARLILLELAAARLGSRSPSSRSRTAASRRAARVAQAAGPSPTGSSSATPRSNSKRPAARRRSPRRVVVSSVARCSASTSRRRSSANPRSCRTCDCAACSTRAWCVPRISARGWSPSTTRRRARCPGSFAWCGTVAFSRSSPSAKSRPSPRPKPSPPLRAGKEPHRFLPAMGSPTGCAERRHAKVP